MNNTMMRVALLRHIFNRTPNGWFDGNDYSTFWPKWSRR